MSTNWEEMQPSKFLLTCNGIFYWFCATNNKMCDLGSTQSTVYINKATLENTIWIDIW